MRGFMGLLSWCHCTRILNPELYMMFEEIAKRNEFLFSRTDLSFIHLESSYCE